MQLLRCTISKTEKVATRTNLMNKGCKVLINVISKRIHQKEKVFDPLPNEVGMSFTLFLCY